MSYMTKEKHKSIRRKIVALDRREADPATIDEIEDIIRGVKLSTQAEVPSDAVATLTSTQNTLNEIVTALGLLRTKRAPSVTRLIINDLHWLLDRFEGDV